MKYESQLMTNATGHVNGLVASRNTYGQYFRSRVAGVNPKTALQTAARAVFGAIAQAWRALTKAQQAAWTTAAPLIVVKDGLGKTIVLTGAAAFQSANRKQTTAGLANFTDPPTAVASQPAISSATFNGSDSSGTISFTSPPTASNPFVILASDVIGVGRNYARKPTTVIGVATANPFTFSATSGNAACDALAAQIGAAAANATVAFGAYAADTNNMPSPTVYSRALVTRP